MQFFKLYHNIEEYYDIKRRINKPKWTQRTTNFVNFFMSLLLKDISNELKNVCAIDMHVHTAYSHCCFDPIEKTLIEANKRGLSGICIMDHHTTEGYKKALEIKPKLVEEGLLPTDFILIPGIEYSTSEGHVGGLFCEKDIYFKKYTAKEAVDQIHKMGGLAICVHPYRKKTGIKDISKTLPFDAVEEEAGSIFKKKYAKLNKEITKDFDYSKFGSSDAHFYSFLGSCYTVFPEGTKTLEDIKEAILNKKTIAKESQNIKIIRNILGN